MKKDKKGRGFLAPSLESATISDIGLVRSKNEDAVFSSEEKGLFVLADGMGGAGGGDIASAIVIAKIEKLTQSSELNTDGVISALENASLEIFNKSKKDDIPGMGSTAIAIIFNGEHTEATVLHAGDSRLYLFREGQLERVTRDHSLKEELKTKMECDTPDLPNMSLIEGRLTKALGLEEDVKVDRTDIAVQSGDQFLLCSDGLTKYFDDELIEDFFSNNGREVNPCRLAQKFIEEAKNKGGKDNISVIVIKVKESPCAKMKKFSLVFLAALVISVFVLGGYYRRARRLSEEVETLKESVGQSLQAEIELTEVELRYQYGMLEETLRLPEQFQHDILARLKERSNEFLQKYKAEAEGAVLARNWDSLDALPEIDPKLREDLFARLGLEKKFDKVLEFGRQKGRLREMWWRFTRMVRDGNFQELSNLSREYSGIVGLVTSEEPVRKIEGLQFNSDTPSENARLLLDNWPFDESRTALKRAVEAMLEE